MELYLRTGSIVVAQRAFREEFQRRDAPRKHSILRYAERYSDEGLMAPQEDMPSHTRRTIENIATVSGAIERRPNESVGCLWHQTGCCSTSVHGILHNDWDVFPYKVQIVQSLTNGDPGKRCHFCKTVSGRGNIFFSMPWQLRSPE